MNNSSTIDTTNSYWLITEVGTYDVLFDAKNLHYWENGGIVSFITNDDKKYVASDFFIFGHDNKPAKELYDVEYGTKEWYDLYTDTETDSQNLTYTSNMLEENSL